MNPPAPPRPWTLETWADRFDPTAPDVERYWLHPPPNPSARCLWWVHRIQGGWRPNNRWRKFGYYEAAEEYGVYIWEYQNVLRPLLVALGSG